MPYFLLFILFFNPSLFAEDDDSKQFDAWNSWIGDQYHFTKAKDRNISTKIVKQDFKLTLASIDKNDQKYENKAAHDTTAENIVQIAIYQKNSSTTRVSNIIKWDPTDNKYIKESDVLHIDGAEKDLIVGMRMCATYKDKKYTLYALDDCSNNSDDTCTKESDKVLNTSTITSSYSWNNNNNENEDELQPTFRICYASNNFSTRPKSFNITQIDENLSSAKDYKFDVIAQNNNGDATEQYDITNANVDDAASAGDAASKLITSWANGDTNLDTKDYNLSLKITKYMPNTNEINNSLEGNGTIKEYRFVDGDATQTNNRYVTFYYNDIGKVQLQLLDQNWTDVDKDDTPSTCSNEDGKDMGRYICGEVNQTFIPTHFYISNAQLFNEQNQSFTYIVKEANLTQISAKLQLNIEAKNDENETTKNFDKNSWVYPLNISFNVENNNTLIKNMITNTILDFNHGNVTISWNETNNNKHLLFNYERNTSLARNPFVVYGDEINISIQANYGDKDINDSNGEDVKIEDNVTFLYARTNAPRTLFEKSDDNKYKVPFYYEIFCYATDEFNNECNKTLLPNGEDSQTTDDPRWFVNTQHFKAFGTAGKVKDDFSQKYHGSGIEVDTLPKGEHQDFVIFKYNKKFPYKTTIQNKASQWLLYNKYDENSTTNEFEVEFLNIIDDDTSWAGTAETGVTTTNKTATQRSNRRVMW